MIISQIEVKDNYHLHVVAEDGRIGIFDVKPYLKSVAFRPLLNDSNFNKIHNHQYFIEWDCGADLSADTIEARWQIIK